MRFLHKPALVSVAILLTAVLLYQVFHLRNSAVVEYSFTRFLDELQKGNIHDVKISDSKSRVTAVNGHLVNPPKAFSTVTPTEYPQLFDMLRAQNVQVTIGKSNRGPWLAIWFSWVLPLLFIVSFCAFLWRRAA